MGYSSGLVTAPVNISDVQNAVGVSGGGDLATIITNGTINKWAKYKPVRLQSNDTVTGQWDATNKVWLASARWWKGTGNCGLSLTTFTNLGNIGNSSSFLYKLKNGQLPWNYERPTGGAYQPFRLQDFARYITYAEPAVGECGVQEGDIVWVERTGSGTVLQIDYDAPSVGDLNLVLSDFEVGGVSLSQFYLGMLLWRDSGNYILVTSTTRIGTNGSNSISVTIGYDDIGNWHMIPFISSVIITVGGSTGAGIYLSAGITTPISFIAKPTGQAIQVFVSAAWSNNNSRIQLFATVFNNISSAQSVTNLTVYVISTTSASQDPSTGQTVTSKNLGNCTVAANSQYDYAQDYVSVQRNQSLYYWVTARPTTPSVFENSYEQVEDEDAPLAD